jgi:hypothetical protein
MSYFVAIGVYFVVIWYIFPVLVCCTKEDLATLFRELYIFKQQVSKLQTDIDETKFRCLARRVTLYRLL